MVTLTSMLLGGRVVLAEPANAVFTGTYILGSTVYTARDFAPDIAAHVGQPTSTAVLESMRSAIRRRYLRDGYVTPIITVPGQDAQSTNPRLIVHEALVNRVEIRGDAGPYRSRIEQLAHELQGPGPLRKEQIRSTLSRISQLPGITSRPLFDQRPGDTNEFLLVLRVEYHPVAGKVELNNAGTRSLGRALLTADLVANDLLGLQEQLSLSGALSSRPDRYQYEQAQLARRFDNTSIFADVSGSTAIPEINGHFRDVHFSTGVSQQLPLAADRVLSFAAALSADNGSIYGSHDAPWIEDHERNIALGVTLSRSDSASGRLYFGAQRGLNILDSQVNEGADSQVNPDYMKYLIEGQKIIPMGDSWNLQFDVDGQMTRAVMPVLERFTFGGIGFGAAFDPGTLSGDSGAEVSAQLAHVIRITRWRIQYLRLYVRADAGFVWNNASYFHHRDEATSAGGGATVRWLHVMATLEVSTPVEQPKYAPDAQSVRTFGSVAYLF